MMLVGSACAVRAMPPPIIATAGRAAQTFHQLALGACARLLSDMLSSFCSYASRGQRRRADANEPECWDCGQSFEAGLHKNVRRLRPDRPVT